MVSARETSLRDLLEGANQYLVPLYQRTYAWEKINVERLWEDIVNLVEDRQDDPSHTHFLGSLVLAPAPDRGPGSVHRYLVVDGQQRLTTLALLLMALRDHLTDRTNDEEHRARITEQYLINRFKPDDQRIKLLPTQADRAAYRALVDTSAAPSAQGTIHRNYTLFRQHLFATDDLDLEALENAILNGLTVVTVTTGHGDNPHRIFESLNNTGVKLTQADLIRNYLFMRLTTRGDTAYESQWKPLQDSLTNDELESLFWIDLVHDDPRVKQTDTYSKQQARLERLSSEEEIEAELRRFTRIGGALRTALHPEHESDPDVRRGLRRLNEWGSTTFQPLLVHLLLERDEGHATDAEVANSLHILESYLVRRLLSGRPNQGMNRVLMSAVTEMDGSLPVDEALHRYLSTGRKHFIDDRTLRDSVRTGPYYLNGRRNHRKSVLAWIEELHGNREPVDLTDTQIEHVLPQTLTDEWSAVLSSDPDEAREIHDQVLHTLGNLTLTGYNPGLSNRPFSEKRAELARSGIRMNQEIAAKQVWDVAAIEARSQAMADRIIDAWPPPLAGAVAPEDGEQWRNFEAVMMALPQGRWATYGDIAAVVGTHARAVATRLACAGVHNPHRVLSGSGHSAEGFHWQDPDDNRTQREALEVDGVRFDGSGRALDEYRLSLAELKGLAMGDDEGEGSAPATDLTALRGEFAANSRKALFVETGLDPADLAEWVVNGTGPWAELNVGAGDDAGPLQDFLGWYAARFFPAPNATEHTHWAMSMSSNGEGPTFGVSAGPAYCAKIVPGSDGDPDVTLWVADSPLGEGTLETLLEALPTESLSVTRSDLIPSGGPDQIRFECATLQIAKQALEIPEIAMAGRLYNARLCQQRTPFGRSHRPEVVGSR